MASTSNSDLRALIKNWEQERSEARSRYHVTLGELIGVLEQADPDGVVDFDIGGHPGDEMSYRGYYEDLAFTRVFDQKTVGDFLAQCSRSLHATYQGYKGGDFVMRPKTPLWVSDYGQYSGTAIIMVRPTPEGAVLHTRYIDHSS